MMRNDRMGSAIECLFAGPDRFSREQDEEYLPDDRIEQRPSEVVQSKLLDLLPRYMAVPVSCLHHRREVRR
ncbi:hypothetical protein BH11PLA2_BH11PLA2_45000 [soil metagenome]